MYGLPMWSDSPMISCDHDCITHENHCWTTPLVIKELSYMASHIPFNTYIHNDISNKNTHTKFAYRQISNVRCSKSQILNDSHLVLPLSLLNPLKPGVEVENEDVVGAVATGILQPHLSDEWFHCLLRCALYYRFDSILWHVLHYSGQSMVQRDSHPFFLKVPLHYFHE